MVIGQCWESLSLKLSDVVLNGRKKGGQEWEHRGWGGGGLKQDIRSGEEDGFNRMGRWGILKWKKRMRFGEGGG
jgi:hypothetical protein